MLLQAACHLHANCLTGSKFEGRFTDWYVRQVLLLLQGACVG